MYWKLMQKKYSDRRLQSLFNKIRKNTPGLKGQLRVAEIVSIMFNEANIKNAKDFLIPKETIAKMYEDATKNMPDSCTEMVKCCICGREGIAAGFRWRANKHTGRSSGPYCGCDRGQPCIG